jgi:cytochrome c biogenesis protein CcmG/thiol:disulfide interchange protein DsbE
MSDATDLPPADSPQQQAPSRPRRGTVDRRELLLTSAGAVVGLLIIGLVWFLTGRAAEPELPAVGELRRPAPEIDLPGLDGGRVRLADHRGKVVMVNFWATWCEPCKEETPALQAVHQQLHDEGLVIIGINLRKQETDDVAIRTFITTYGVTYPIALDIEAEAARLFQISPIPTSYFIDPRGDIRFVRVGTITADEVIALTRALQREVIDQ